MVSWKGVGCIVYLFAWCNLRLISLTLHGIALLHRADCASVKLDCPQALHFSEEQIGIEHMEEKINLILIAENDQLWLITWIPDNK